ncbi:MAG: DoxX family protein [Burkholderiales bacterium]|nr:DoxX family protein [Opitutaceae bacterium]
MWRWSYFDRWHDLGLLVLRTGVGAVFLFIHGIPKLTDPSSWARIGRAVSYLGIDFAHQSWGLAAILAMTAGATCLILGFLQRPAALLLTITMLVAAIWRHYPFGGWNESAYPATMAIVCFALMILGPGKYALAAR